MENYIGKICPFCKTEIKEGESVKVCPACGIPHHESCWQENRGCTTFGCSQLNYEAQGTNPTAVCVNCGATLGDGQAFCSKCGTPKAAPQNTVCSKCGAQLQAGQEFCPMCGQKVGLAVDPALNNAINQFNAGVEQKKKKSKVLPIILAIVVALGAVFGGIGYKVSQDKKAAAAAEAERLRQEAADAYIADACEFYIAVLASGGTMEKIGNEIQKSWKAYVNSTSYNYKRYYSVDTAVAAAIVYMSSEVTSVENADSSIEAAYKALLTVPDTSNQELMEIKEAVKDVFSAYQDMYDCVISPSGNYNSWTSEFGDVDSALADTLEDLGTLVK